jgi:glycerol kinase
MATNDWLAQFLADMLGTPVERPANAETTATGAAFLAGLVAGCWSGLDDLPVAAGLRRFDPVSLPLRDELRAQWSKAIARALWNPVELLRV